MRWLLRLLVLRILGPRAVPILALLGLIRAVRDARGARRMRPPHERAGRGR